jgi:hypothetical protein
MPDLHPDAWALALLLLAFAAPPASAGPYGDERSGLPWTSTLFRAWAADAIHPAHPDPDSGGFARDDQGAATHVGAAVAGRPADFTLDAATRHVYSLGNGGRVIVVLPEPIRDGPGPDFAVFENGFTDETTLEGTLRDGATNSFHFAELAYVEVGSSTSAWARFPCAYLGTSVFHNLNNLEENRFASQDVTDLDGLAGKHAIGQGTPFDLAALATNPAVTGGAVDLRWIRYIRLVDVVGDGSATDDAGRPIHDPYYDFQNGYPSPAPAAWTDGFDLRAVGLINLSGLSIAPAPGAGPLELAWFVPAGVTDQVEVNIGDGGWSAWGAPVPGTNGLERRTITGGTPVGLLRISRSGP